jgi:hypothetical protein
VSEPWQLDLYPTPDAAYVFYFPYVKLPDTLAGGTAIYLPKAFLRAVQAEFFASAFEEHNTAGPDGVHGKYDSVAKTWRAKAEYMRNGLPKHDRGLMLSQPLDVYDDVDSLTMEFQE